jgi:translation initiation factor 1
MSKRIPVDDATLLVHRPFAGLGGSTAPAPAPATVELSKPARAERVPAWAVVRRERKGRGGKEVTVIEKLDLRAKELEAWTKDLKQHLGCGGAVEDGAILLQGDQRERAAGWLERRGVKKVTRG